MQRSFAHLVLLVVFWSYAAPAVLAATELDLPPCCRSNGRHHRCMCCAMRSAGDASAGFRANSPQCPCRLQGIVITGSIAAVARGVFSLELPPASSLAPAAAISRVSAVRFRKSGRGPPASL
jgi:hypothetical protein